MKSKVFTPGNPKRERKITKDWWDRAVLKATTQDDIADELKKLKESDPKFWLRLVLDSVPRHIVNENNGLVVRIVLDGIVGKSIPIPGQMVKGELSGHETE